MAFQIAGVTFLYMLACLGLGGAITQCLLSRGEIRQSAPTSFWLAQGFLLGGGLLANLWVLISLIGWFSPAIVWGVTLAFALVGVTVTIRLQKTFLSELRTIWQDIRNESWDWQIVALLVAVIGLTQATALGNSALGDGTAAYLTQARLIAATHTMVPVPGIYSDMIQVGLQGEMHYAALMAMGIGDGARLFTYPNLIAALIILLVIGKVCGLRARGLWLSAAIYFSTSALLWLNGNGKVDIFALGLGLAAVYWVLLAGKKGDVLAEVFCGTFCGLALLAKISYLPPLIPGIGIMLIWQNIRTFYNTDEAQRQIRPVLRQILLGGSILVCGILVMYIPQFFKNGMLYDNPLAPFGTQGMGWLDQTWLSPQSTQRMLLTYPLALTFGRYAAQSGRLSPLILAFAPALLALKKPEKFWDSRLVQVTCIAIIGLVAWIISRPSVLAPRYFLATLMLLIPLFSRGFEAFSYTPTYGILVRGFSMGAIGISLFSAVIVYTRAPQLEANEDRAYRLATERLAENIEPGKRILYLGSYRYWLRPDLIQCLDTRTETIFDFTESPETRWQRIFAHGFEFLWVDITTHQAAFEALAVNQTPDWVNVTPILKAGDQQLFSLQYSDPPGKSRIACQTQDNLIWRLASQ